MSYQYPEHFKYPEGERYFFLNHVPMWKHFLGDFGNEPRVTLEIGALYGGSSVYILEEFCKQDGSQHYIMDINTNEYIEKQSLAYLLNRYLNPLDKGFFEDKQIKINEDIWALSELLQWIWRSQRF